MACALPHRPHARSPHHPATAIVQNALPRLVPALLRADAGAVVQTLKHARAHATACAAPLAKRGVAKARPPAGAIAPPAGARDSKLVGRAMAQTHARFYGFEDVQGLDPQALDRLRHLLADHLDDRRGSLLPLRDAIQRALTLTPREQEWVQRRLEEEGRREARLYERELLTARAKLIAEMEVRSAVTQGQITAARATGARAGTVKEKVWTVAEDPCEDCAELDGEQVGLDEPFSSGDDGPPAHPNCRCHLSIVSVEEGDRE